MPDDFIINIDPDAADDDGEQPRRACSDIAAQGIPQRKAETSDFSIRMPEWLLTFRYAVILTLPT